VAPLRRTARRGKNFCAQNYDFAESTRQNSMLLDINEVSDRPAARQGIEAPMKPLFSALAMLLLALFVVSACSEENNPPKPDIPFLTSDGHFLVGGQHIVVPMIALRGPEHVFALSREKPAKTSKEVLKERATDPRSPMLADSLSLLVHQYEMRDQHGASTEICPSLTRLWAQVVCRGQQKGVLKRVPEKFDLLDGTKLSLLKSRYTVGGEQEYDHVRKMPLRPGVTEIACDKDSKFCTAAVEAKPGLLAIWTVWSGEDQTAAEMAAAQGAAIVQFVRRAVGPVEDKTLTTTE
jgi:hypothetical protein